MKKKIIPLLLASSVLVVACDQQGANNSTSSATAAASAATVKKEDAVAVVNGTYISKGSLNTLEAEIAQRSQGKKFPKEQLLEELIQRELLVQDAKQKKLDQSSEVVERIQMAKRSLLSQAALQNFIKSSPVTDAEIKVEYDKEMAKSSGVEFKARHILIGIEVEKNADVKTKAKAEKKAEEKAKKLIAKLAKGAKFEELAKKHSTGPSGPQGGDLGWFVDGQMVKPFSEAVVALENGKFTQAPVKTQFGWHIILREESREQTPPPFEAIKEQLRPALQQQKVQKMLENLRKQAKVEIFISVEEPKAEKPVSIPPVATENKTTETEVETVEKQAKEIDAAEVIDIVETEKASKTEEPAKIETETETRNNY